MKILVFCLSKILKLSRSVLKNFFYNDKQEIKNILIIRLGGIGDNIILTSIISPLKEKFQSSKISVLTSSSSICVYEKNKSIKEIINSKFLDSNNLKDLIKNFSFNEISTIFNKIKNFDLIIFAYAPNRFMGFLKLFFIATLNFKAKLIGLDFNRMGDFLDYKIYYKPYQTHEIEYLKKILLSLGIEKNNLIIPPFEVNKNDEYYIEKLFKKNNISKEYITIHASTSDKDWRIFKRIDLKVYLEVIDFLINEYNFDIVLLGSMEDYEYNKKIKTQINSKSYKVHNLSGLLTLEQAAYVLEKSKLFIGNDSSMAHLASSTHVPIIVLFTFSDYIGYKPYSNNTFVIRKNLKCSPCIYEKRYLKCENKECRNISSSDIINAIKKILNL